MGLPPILIDKDVAAASTMPSAWYVEPRALELELEHVIERSWQFAGPLSRLPEPGSYFTTVIGREPVLLTRDRNGAVRAMSNVCRHRAGLVARGEGCRPILQCTYHGWVYELDGNLRSAPEFDGVQNFDGACLPQFRVQTWQGLIFVDVSGLAPAFEEVFGAIDERLRGRDLTALTHTTRKDWEIRCNWKIYVDNYLEGYHIPIVHPQLFRELDYNNYRTETAAWFSIQHSPIRRPERLRSLSPGDEAIYFWVYPNLMLNIYPDNFSTNLIVPVDVGTTVTVFEWFFERGGAPAEELERVVGFSDEVQIEDIEVCEDVQRNLRSATYDRGRYSARRENGVHHFHSLLARSLEGTTQ